MTVHCETCTCSDPLSDVDADTPGRMHTAPTDTEKLAAYRVMPRTGSQRRRVLDYLFDSDGHTDDELQQRVCPGAAARRNELRDGGWVKDSGRRRDTSKGGVGIVWVVTNRGRRAIRRGEDL